MDRSKANENDNEDPDELIEKYRVSWANYSDIQRQAICNRLELTYTSVYDKNLLRIVAERQQQYRRSQAQRQERRAAEKMKKVVHIS